MLAKDAADPSRNEVFARYSLIGDWAARLARWSQPRQI